MSTPYLGEIKITSFNFAPKYWALCNGQLLSIAQNSALFSILGTTYGGNGQTTFALPNLQGRTPVHTGNSISLGQVAGEENHTLTISEMPSHNHAVVGNSGIATANSPVGNTWAAQTANPYNSLAPNTTMAPSALANSGSSQAHTNMQPYLVVNFIIALQGIYPSRN